MNINQHFKILIVDDEEQSCDLIENLLHQYFPFVQTDQCDKVDMAVSKIESDPPDLIFLDIQMRGETGFDLLDKIQVRAVIFITAYSEFAIKAFRYSATDYLLKPIDKAKLLDRLRDFALCA